MLNIPLDDEAVVDLDRPDERQESDDQQLISSSSSSCSLKKGIAAAAVILVCFSGIIFLTVWQLNKASVVPTPPTTTPEPGPPHIPTVRPLPKNASDWSAEDLLYLVFEKSQLDYVEVKCIPQSPPTFKFILQVENFANYTGESNTRHHARVAVSRQAAETMFGFDYSDHFPVPPPPQPCQLL